MPLKARPRGRPSPTARAGNGPSAAWAFSSLADRAGGRVTTRTSASVFKALAEGVALRVTGTAALDRNVLLPRNNADKPGAGDFTVAIDFYLRGGVNGFGAIGRWNTGASPSTCDWLLGAGNNFGSTGVTFSVASGATIYQANIASTWVTGRRFTLVGRRRGTTITVNRYDHTSKVWETASTTNAGITTINANSARKLKLGEIDAGAIYNVDLDALHALLFPRALSDAEVLALTETAGWAKWFQPERRVLVPGVAAAGGGATGTVAVTAADDAGSAQGTTTVVGSLARTAAGDASSASGTTAVVGSFARTNASDTSAASGSPVVVGSSARTNANDTASASGAVGASISGSGSPTNANDAGSAAGATTVQAAAAATAGSDSGSAAGTTTVAGTGAGSGAADTSSAVGTTRIVATGAPQAAGDTASASGITGALTGTGSAVNGDDYATTPVTPTGAGHGSRYAAERHGRIHLFETEEELLAWLAEHQPKLEQKVKKAAKRIAKEVVRSGLAQEPYIPQIEVDGPAEVKALANLKLAILESTFNRTVHEQIARERKRLDDEEEEAAVLLLL